MEEEAIRIPIDGVLDLHTFSPRDIKKLIPDYLEECLQHDIFQVRIIHGKGKGVLRRTVHAILARFEIVESFHCAPENAGGWGATIVLLRRSD